MVVNGGGGGGAGEVCARAVAWVAMAGNAAAAERDALRVCVRDTAVCAPAVARVMPMVKEPDATISRIGSGVAASSAGSRSRTGIDSTLIWRVGPQSSCPFCADIDGVSESARMMERAV